jgi:hypothetical protein
MNILGIDISFPYSHHYNKEDKDIRITKRIETDEFEVCRAKIIETSSWLGLRKGKIIAHLKNDGKIRIKKVPK